MKVCTLSVFLLALLGCSSGQDKLTKLSGHWGFCHKKGLYIEQVFGEKEFYLFTKFSGTEPAVYGYRLNNRTLSINGISRYTTRKDTFQMGLEIISENEMIISTKSIRYELMQINRNVYPASIDQPDNWVESVYEGFEKRQSLRGCVNQESEEDLPDLGRVEDDFEDLYEADRIPDWALEEWEKHQSVLEQSFGQIPSILTADFTGDGTTDLAIWVADKTTGKEGIMFISRENNATFFVGAGLPIEPGANDDYTERAWELFTDKNTYEMTITPNGDLGETKQIKLDHPAISIRETEGSGGLIYFNGEKFIWIHQGD